MRIKWLFGKEYWMVGAFWSVQNQSWYVFPCPLVGVRISFYPSTSQSDWLSKQLPLTDNRKRVIVCANCGHGQEVHQAAPAGYRQGALGEKIQNVSWDCSKCQSAKPCPGFVVKVETL